MSLEEWVRSPSQRSGSRARCKRLEPDDDDDNDDDDDDDDGDDDDDDHNDDTAHIQPHCALLAKADGHQVNH